MTERRPTPLEVRPDGVPSELVDHDQWVDWRYEWIDDREEWTKVPYDATTGRKAKSSNSNTWTSFDNALEYHHRDDTDTDGIGITVHDGDDLVGLDIDDCRDPDSGTVDAWAVEIATTIDSYTEVSPSATGLRIFIMGKLPDGVKHRTEIGDGKLEVYETGRYLTVTGHKLSLPSDRVERRQDALEELIEEYLTEDEPEARPNGGLEVATAPQGGGDGRASAVLTDKELLEKARHASNGDTFRQLYDRGDTAGYPSHSEARQALANLLAFWTGGDEARMLRLFQASKLYRGPDDRRTFENYEIPTALKGRTEFYDPSDHTGASVDREADPIAARFVDACEARLSYRSHPTHVATVTEDGEERHIDVADVVGGCTIAEAINSFNEKARALSGTKRQAVIGHVLLDHLRDTGEFFKTPIGPETVRVYYFDDDTERVYRVDGEGRRTLGETFQDLVWERYQLSSGSFSRNLGKDLLRGARYHAPERDVYRFAHFNEDAGVLYVADFGSGYYAVSPEGIEHRRNGTDIYFLDDGQAEPYTYLEPGERDPLPDAIPAEIDTWAGQGDALMRVFCNRVNFRAGAAAGPEDYRDLLYLYLHSLPFIDLLNARPIAGWEGEKGSGKTVIQRAIGRFIYGPDFTESVMPDSRDDFIAKVSNQALAFIDNYDEAEDWADDVLAAIATGAGVDKRQLYTTNALVRDTPRCWISITSRDPPFRRDDVADRTLPFRLDRIDPDVEEDGPRFVGMGTYLRQVTDRRDLLWSVYLDNLREIVRQYGAVDVDTLGSTHRMADFAVLVKIIADALTVGDAHNLLDRVEAERSAFALEDEPWAHVLGRWVRDDDTDASTWRKAKGLLDTIEEWTNDLGDDLGITDTAVLGKKLSNYRKEIGSVYGLEVDESGKTNRYRFVDDRVDDGDDTTTDAELRAYEEGP